MSIPSLPAQGSTAWFAWAQGLHNAAASAMQASDIGAGNTNDLALRAALGTFHNVKAILGTDASQWPAQLEAAFAAYPGETFFFPDGQYGLNRQLNVAHNNSLILAPGARIYASAAMDSGVLINYETADTITPTNHLTLPQGKVISGGWLDGAGLAGSVLRVAVFEGLHVENMQITDGRYRGLIVDRNKLATPGAPAITAEGIFRGLHIYNTTANWTSNNVGVEVLAGDCHFHDIIVIDWTTAIRDNGNSLWLNPHVWLSQIGPRYPTSIAFDLGGSSRMLFPYADTYRTGWNCTAGVPQLLHPDFQISNEFVSAATNTANPATVFALAGASGVKATEGAVSNYIDPATGNGVSGSSMVKFLSGTVTNLVDVDGMRFDNFPAAVVTDYVPGFRGDYVAGNLQDVTAAWGATLVGTTTAGTASYTDTSGRLQWSRKRALLTAHVAGTLDSSIAGGLRIPLPPGIVPSRLAIGSVGYVSGLPAGMFAQVGPGDAGIALLSGATTPNTEVDASAQRGHTFEVAVAINID